MKGQRHPQALAHFALERWREAKAGDRVLGVRPAMLKPRLWWPVFGITYCVFTAASAKSYCWQRDRNNR